MHMTWVWPCQETEWSKGVVGAVEKARPRKSLTARRVPTEPTREEETK